MNEIHDHTVNRLESLCEIRGEDGKIPAKYQEYHDILAVIKSQDAKIERLHAWLTEIGKKDMDTILDLPKMTRQALEEGKG